MRDTLKSNREQSELKHLTDTLIHKMILAETIGRHLTYLEGEHDALVTYYHQVGKEIEQEAAFPGYTKEQINEMRLEVIEWCKARLEALK